MIFSVNKKQNFLQDILPGFSGKCGRSAPGLSEEGSEESELPDSQEATGKRGYCYFVPDKHCASLC